MKFLLNRLKRFFSEPKEPEVIQLEVKEGAMYMNGIRIREVSDKYAQELMLGKNNEQLTRDIQKALIAESSRK